MSDFRSINRDIDFLLPPSVQDWLPEGQLARYVVEAVDALDLSARERAYAGRAACLPPINIAVGGGFEQCYNAQSVIDNEAMLVLVP